MSFIYVYLYANFWVYEMNMILEGRRRLCDAKQTEIKL
jgi:hypothetical protein